MFAISVIPVIIGKTERDMYLPGGDGCQKVLCSAKCMACTPQTPRLHGSLSGLLCGRLRWMNGPTDVCAKNWAIIAKLHVVLT